MSGPSTRRRPIVVLGVAVALAIVVGAGLLIRHQRAAYRRREQAREQMAFLLGTDGHRRHAGLLNVDCASCHQGGRPAAQTCTGACHEPAGLHPQHPEADSCVSCHRFSLAKEGEKPGTVAECARCHAGSDTTKKAVTPDVLHGRVDCKLCHEPHGTIDATAMRDCARCHDFGKDPLSGPEEHRVCAECHEEHGAKAAALASCAKCHEKDATGIARSKRGGHMASVMPAGTQPPTAALRHASCASCHRPHDWKADRSGCLLCHEKEADLVREKSPAKHGQCTDCHGVHDTWRAGVACARCHTAQAAHPGEAPARHRECSACHEPHAARAKAARETCTSCHTSEHAQLAKWGPSHAKLGCLGCHASHGNPRSGQVTCARCHGEHNNLALAAPQAKHRECVSCHEPHLFATGIDIDAVCASCHDSVTAEGMIHRGECKTCHASHGSPSVPRAACIGCHKTIQLRPTHSGSPQHAACAACHQPHRPAAAAPATCKSCHASKLAAATASPGHAQECSRCHPSHDVDATPSCESCHAPETVAAKGSRHTCKQCHRAHKPRPGIGPAWRQACSGCHAGQAAAVEHRGPAHSDCAKCHRAHGSGAVPCVSCHTDIAGKGEHHVKEHAKCQSCHNAHASASVTRAQCIACHKDMLPKHHPDAQFCQTCHAFQ